MATESFDIDPNGDVLLILRNPRPSLAVWDENKDPSRLPHLDSRPLVDEVFIPEWGSMKEKMRKRKERRKFDDFDYPVPVLVTEPDIPLEEAVADPSGPADNPVENLEDPPEFLEAIAQATDHAPEHDETGAEFLQHGSDGSDGSEDLDTVTVRVCSRHLMLASPYFSRMLKGSLKEGNSIQNTGAVDVEVKDIYADALVILMNIIHGKTRSVPKEVDLDTLAKMAVLVDLYECAEAVEVFSDMWIAHLREALPSVYSRDTVLWICISWVFRQRNVFKLATSAALKYSNGPIQSLLLPIPPRVVGKRHQLS
ncbi:MAG: hypothetical protein M1820_001212 [Bogoriella megaspora]|nr:MAG: hypothetical protein M1820_001212 [Bogoriella megaspora]